MYEDVGMFRRALGVGREGQCKERCEKLKSKRRRFCFYRLVGIESGLA